MSCKSLFETRYSSSLATFGSTLQTTKTTTKHLTVRTTTSFFVSTALSLVPNRTMLPQSHPLLRPFQRLRLSDNSVTVNRRSCPRRMEIALCKLWTRRRCKPLLPMPVRESCRVIETECALCTGASMVKSTKPTWSMATYCECTDCLHRPMTYNLSGYSSRFIAKRNSISSCVLTEGCG